MVPYLRAANVKDGVLDLTDVKRMNFTPSEQRVFSLRPGDVLVTEGSGSLGTVGASAVWRGEVEGTVCFQNTLLRMRPREGVTDSRFLGWWARSAFGSGLFASVASGANIYHISAERVRALPIELPSLEEQRRIADYLDAETTRLDALVNARRHQLERLGELWTSHLATQVEAMISSHGLIPLRRAIQSVMQGWSPRCEEALAEPHEWAVLKTSAVSSGLFRPLEHKKLPSDLQPDFRYQIADGDLLMTRGSGSIEHVGVPTVAYTEGRSLLLSDLLYRVRADRGWRPDLIALILRSPPVRVFMTLLMRGQSGQTIKLRSEDIKAIDIPAVPAEQQERLAADLSGEEDRVLAASSAIESSAALLSERRQALITAAVTGQLDVTTARQGAGALA